MWRVAAASVRGAAHQRAGTPCQDACLFAETGDVLIAAVADGAGSATLADVGARLAVAAAVAAIAQRDRLVELLGHADRTTELLRCGFDAAFEAIGVEADERGCAANDLASTLIVAVAAPDLVAAGQIGDGASVIEDPGGWRCLTTPQGGEYANETTFLTSAGREGALQVRISPGSCAHLALLTDGLQRLALNMADAAPHAPFFVPLFRFLREAVDTGDATHRLTRLLTSPRVGERTDDDLTLLLAARVE